MGHTDMGGSDLVTALRNQLDLLVTQADRKPATLAMMEGRAGRDLYVSFLVQSHHYVALTYPCLLAAGRRMKELGQHDFLADLFFQKAEEERDHDVLIEEDLRALGLDPERVLAADGPGGWVNAYNTWIRAATSGRHPAAFLGSAYLLEGLATLRAGPLARALVASGRIPKIAEAVTFLDLHAEADVGHVDDMDRLLADLDDPIEQDAIVMTAAATRGAYLGMLDDVADSRLAAAA